MIIQQAQDDTAVEEIEYRRRRKQGQHRHRQADEKYTFQKTDNHTQRAIYFAEQFNTIDEYGKNFT